MENIEQIIKICKERGELDFLFAITKEIAESDSIGEEYNYCSEYTQERFNNAERHLVDDYWGNRGLKDWYCRWLEFGGVPVYRLYLEHIGALEK